MMAFYYVTAGKSSNSEKNGVGGHLRRAWRYTVFKELYDATFQPKKLFQIKNNSS